ncbi:hypothetical protein [Kineococcus terrestris]|uniref:hypothetical protein n=1 Tax=Kineococcus terrestris TaxID=2044856 RepID=UPI0034DB15CA
MGQDDHSAMAIPHAHIVNFSVTTELFGSGPTPIRANASLMAAHLGVSTPAVVDLLMALDGRRIDNKVCTLLIGLFPDTDEDGQEIRHRSRRRLAHMYASWEELREWYADMTGLPLPRVQTIQKVNA